MIGHLKGTLALRAPDRVVLDVGGVGYEVHIPLSTFYQTAASGSEVSLHIHTHVREDALQLFGFATAEERATFELLIAISGVGPRLALAILSGIGVDELRSTVVGKDRARLQKIPGVGKKTAERVLLELGDRLGRVAGGAKTADTRPAERDASEPGGIAADAASALVNLGYAREVARRAVDGALETLGPDAALEDVLRGALAGLVR